MGLSVAQNSFLCLTRRKADCELSIALANNQKWALTREQSALSREYSSKLGSKDLAFYANGKYNKITYSYLMGNRNYSAVLNETEPRKTENSMILTDYKGQVVLSSELASAITSVIPNSIDRLGRGATFSTSEIAKILAEICIGTKAEDFQAVIDGNMLNDKTVTGSSKNSSSGEITGSATSTTNGTDMYQRLVDFYYPIFAAAATNGWTTEYETQMNQNPDYISDAIISGAFQLATVNNNGQYEADTSLTFYTNAGYIETVSDAESQQEINAWYDAEKARIAEKETYLDILISDLSTEHEAIKVELESLQTIIDDNITRTMSWGTSA